MGNYKAKVAGAKATIRNERRKGTGNISKSVCNGLATDLQVLICCLVVSLPHAHVNLRRSILSLGTILTHRHGIDVDETFLKLLGQAVTREDLMSMIGTIWSDIRAGKLSDVDEN